MGQRHCNEIFSALRVDVGPVERRWRGDGFAGKLHFAVTNKTLFYACCFKPFVLPQCPLPIYKFFSFTLSRFVFNAFWFICLFVWSYLYIYFFLWEYHFWFRPFLFTSFSSGTQLDRHNIPLSIFFSFYPYYIHHSQIQWLRNLKSIFLNTNKENNGTSGTTNLLF